MDSDESSIPECINPNNFPAKLWRLVNNPAYEAICWDSHGKVIVIDQPLFELQILSPGALLSDAFKTTNFSSFVRQLNLYGFKKTVLPLDHQCSGDRRTLHYFYNLNFQRSHSTLLANLRRLTVDNKAKLLAGVKVNIRPPSRCQLLGGGAEGADVRVERGSSSLLSPTHRESAHPYFSNYTQILKAHNGTPVPPRFLIRGDGAALTPSVFAIRKEIPGSSGHHHTGVASHSNAVHIQQGLLNRPNYGNPNFTGFSPPNAQYQPAFYSPVWRCYHPNLVAPHVAGGNLQTGLFSPQSSHQAGNPVNVLHHGNYNQDQEEKKCNMNLNAVFQIADEMMQTPPNSILITVETPEKPVSVSEPSSNTSNSDSAMKVNPVCVRPIILSVLGTYQAVEHEQQEESVVSVPELMPKDAIIEVSFYIVEFLKALRWMFS